ncbi:hypothetical protein GSY69_08475 [Brevibacterium sp. 5221]|uniref:Lipoprotein n=1 Tax=Brevibacterium rongguiense TaxID=2695267 RepID=A0A6N9H7C2_9MICO|nr:MULTISPECIES: hypothetical protein [Brevibacterium]MYM19997.1 hypothetical protein [Brevibacterium rongguiense]WAL40289.1 hypothetical protein BRM1_13880 [Brevibacterium sp. BRM-1]
MKRVIAAGAASTAALALLSGCQFLPFGPGQAKPEADASEGAAAAATSPAASSDPNQVVGGQASPTGGGAAGNGGGSAGTGAPAGERVDPADYAKKSEYTGTNYYFYSPSEKHRCEIAADVVGCTSLAIPASAPDVVGTDGLMGRPNTVELYTGKKARLVQNGDATYDSMAASLGKGTVLGYGQVLSVRGTTCTVAKAKGVTCTRGGHGFSLSSKAYEVH